MTRRRHSNQRNRTNPIEGILKKWEYRLLLIGILVAAIPVWFYFRDKQQSIANIHYQLVPVNPYIGGGEFQGRDDVWSGHIEIINEGPATADTFVITFYLAYVALENINSHSPGFFLAEGGAGADVKVEYAGSDITINQVPFSRYYVTVKNLVPQNYVNLEAIFIVPPDKKDTFLNEWKTLMFDRKFMGHFYKYISTSGDDHINAVIEGIAIDKPIKTWEASDIP